MRATTTAVAIVAAAVLTGCTSHQMPGTTSSPATTAPMPADGHHAGTDGEMSAADRNSAMLATAAYQDVAVAEAAGYASSIDTLGCFQNPNEGGMGVHYIDRALLDDHVDVSHPEALVYELDAGGAIAGLIAHEYIVPVEVWTRAEAPQLFGRDFHRHPTLPLWVLHAWLWKDNPRGVFADWNPAVRLCPAGAPIFGAVPPGAAPPTTAPARQGGI